MQILKKSLLTLALASFAFASQAATVHVKFDDPIFNGSGFDNVQITYQKLGGGTKTQGASAGRFQGTASNPQGVNPGIFVDNTSDLLTYCYDIYQTIDRGQDVDYTLNFFGATARTLDFLGAVNSVMGSADPYAWLHPATGLMGAAIQLGIWESLYDTGNWNISSGSFMASGLETATEGYLTSFFNAIPGSSSLDAKYTLVLEAAGAQDMLTGQRPQFGPATQVPEPGSLALIGLGLVGLAAVRRVRKAV